MIFNKTALVLGVASTLVLASCSKTEDSPENSAPTASPTISGSILSANAKDVDSDTLTYKWTVGGVIIGSAAIIDIDSPTIQVTGERTVILEVSDGTATVTKTITNVDFGTDSTGGTTNTAPVASFTQSGTVLSSTSSDAQNNISTHTWFVDGVAQAGSSTTFNLATSGFSGSHNVSLKVTDTGGLSNTSAAMPIDFGGTSGGMNTAPVASFTQSGTVLSSTSTDAQNNISTHTWLVDGVAQAGSSTTFNLATSGFSGSHNVSLKVTDTGGLSNTSAAMPIDFGGTSGGMNTAPVASFTQSGTILSSTSTDSENNISTHTWFVDGVAQAGSSTTFNLATSGFSGAHNVSLMVTDTDGLSHSTVAVSIDFGGTSVGTNDAPVVSTIVLSGSNLVATATDDQAISGLTYSWTVAGVAQAGTGSTIAAPSGVTGSKNVTVIATDALGASSVIKQVSINFGSTTNPGDDDVTGTNPPTQSEIDAVLADLGPDAENEGAVVFIPVEQGSSALDIPRSVLVTDNGNFTLPYVPSIDYGTANSLILDNFNDGDHQNNLGAAVATLYGENYTEGGGYWYSFKDSDGSTVTNRYDLEITPFNIFDAVEARPSGQKEFCIDIDVIASITGVQDGYAGVGTNILYEEAVVNLSGLQSVEFRMKGTGAPIPMFEPNREALGLEGDWGNYAADPVQLTAGYNKYKITVDKFMGEMHSDLEGTNLDDNFEARKFFFQVKDDNDTSFCIDYIKFNGIGITSDQFPWKEPGHTGFAKTIAEMSEEVAKPNIFDPLLPYLDWDTVPELPAVSTPTNEDVKTNGELASLPANWISRDGVHLKDSSGDQVRLTGVNWFGVETKALIPMGLWTRGYKDMMNAIKSEGFNTIRIPYSDFVITESRANPPRITLGDSGDHFGNLPLDIDLSIGSNSDFSASSTPIDILDKIVAYAQEIELKIILDSHSRGPDAYLHEGHWVNDDVFGENYDESVWIGNWEFLANRYKNMDSVVAMDLNNEPHYEASWGSQTNKNVTDGNNWNEAAQRAGNAILAINPNVLIIVEGVENVHGKDETAATSLTSYWWGGNLQAVNTNPIMLTDNSKLVYSPHEYGPEVFLQPWFTDHRFPQNLKYIWEDRFGFIYSQGLGHQLIGEFGIRDEVDGSLMEAWFEQWLEYMSDRKDGYSFTYWAWNPNSGDTGGILTNDWMDTHDWKTNLLKGLNSNGTPNVDRVNLLAPMIGNGPASESDINK